MQIMSDAKIIKLISNLGQMLLPGKVAVFPMCYLDLLMIYYNSIISNVQPKQNFLINLTYWRDNQICINFPQFKFPAETPRVINFLIVLYT